jgi:hypothetical protein
VSYRVGVYSTPATTQEGAVRTTALPTQEATTDARIGQIDMKLEVIPIPVADGSRSQHSFKRRHAMSMLMKATTALAAGAALATSAVAQSAKEIRGASPYVAIENEPAPKLIVDAPLPEGLRLGVFWAQYRVENLHIAPVFGPGAVQASPRVGHLHVIVDDLPWWWADASDNNTIDIANLPPGQHKVKIELVSANHEVFPGQTKTVTFTIPEGASLASHTP